VKRLFSENVDLAQMAKTKIIFGKKKSRFGEKKAFLLIKKIGTPPPAHVSSQHMF
jgi:molybdopterin-guanine dinucleotide biosynthesis protein A